MAATNLLSDGQLPAARVLLRPRGFIDLARSWRELTSQLQTSRGLVTSEEVSEKIRG